MIDFPASPIAGQLFTSGSQQWIWDGVKWVPNGSSTPVVVQAMNDNRIINGDMRIDQRNNGVAGTAVNVYTVDRWYFGSTATGKLTWQRIAAPAGLAALGYGYYLSFGSSGAYVSAATDNISFQQPIEADQITDFAWGAAGAQPVTLSFIAATTVLGTYSGSVRNYAGTRSYPFQFSLPNTNWNKIVINIPGDTAGTWGMSGTGGALTVNFDLGCGSNFRGPANAWASANYIGVTGAASVVASASGSLQITGVKLEIGSVATPFNRQSLAKSFTDCQRYYQVLGPMYVYGYPGAGQAFAQTYIYQPMRAAPSGANVVFSGVAYTNASGLGSAANTTSSIFISASATATGAANASFTLALNAEL